MARRKGLEVEEVAEVEEDPGPESLTFEFGVIMATFICLLIAIGLAWYQMKAHYGAGPLG